jgi:hypothetical protein
MENINFKGRVYRTLLSKLCYAPFWRLVFPSSNHAPNVFGDMCSFARIDSWFRNPRFAYITVSWCVQILASSRMQLAACVSKPIKWAMPSAIAYEMLDCWPQGNHPSVFTPRASHVPMRICQLLLPKQGIISPPHAKQDNDSLLYSTK